MCPSVTALLHKHWGILETLSIHNIRQGKIAYVPAKAFELPAVVAELCWISRRAYVSLLEHETPKEEKEQLKFMHSYLLEEDVCRQVCEYFCIPSL